MKTIFAILLFVFLIGCMDSVVTKNLMQTYIISRYFKDNVSLVTSDTITADYYRYGSHSYVFYLDGQNVGTFHYSSNILITIKTVTKN